MSKRPVGNGWQLKPVQQVRESASGYGMLLAANGLCSIDPDNVQRAREGLRRCGFDLDEVMAVGVRTTSTRPGSGGRSTFRAPEGLGRVVFRSKRDGTLLELRAGQPNLQDCLPGTEYRGKDGDGPYQQGYANGRAMDDAPPLPAAFEAWWWRCFKDLEFRRQQEALFCGADDARLSISAGEGSGRKLAYSSHLRRDFNAAHSVPEIIGRHGYVSHDGERWAPPTATGAACVRLIPGHDDLWQSDHGSDPLLGTFDAWVAYVVLDHDGDQAAAEAAFQPRVHASLADAFDVIEVIEDRSAKDVGPEQPAVFAELDLADLDVVDAAPPEFVLPGLIPCGLVTLLSAHGGVGKSILGLMLAVCTALGLDFLGIPTRRCRVVVFSAEDGARLLRYRLQWICRCMGVQAADLAGWLHVLDATDGEPALFQETAGGGRPKLTVAYQALANVVQAHGAGLLVVDNASDTYEANEIDRAQVRRFMRALGTIGKANACAVVLLAHIDKGTSRGDRGPHTEGYSGSTAWHNSARSRLYLSREKSGALKLEHQKNNLGRLHDPILLHWPEGGLPQVMAPAGAQPGDPPPRDDLSVVLQLLAESRTPVATSRQSEYNARAMLKRGLDDAGVDVARVFDLLLDAEHAGLVRRQDIEASRGKTRNSWLLTPAGQARAGTAPGAPSAQAGSPSAPTVGGAPGAPPSVPRGMGTQRAHNLAQKAPPVVDCNLA